MSITEMIAYVAFGAVLGFITETFLRPWERLYDWMGWS